MGLDPTGISDLDSGYPVCIEPFGAKMVQIVALAAFRAHTLIGKVPEHVTAVQTEPAVGLIEQAPSLPSLDKAKRDESKEQQRERKKMAELEKFERAKRNRKMKFERAKQRLREARQRSRRRR